MAFVGDTVRLQVHFKTFEGVYINPNTISLKIYDNAKNERESLIISDENKLDNGKYFYDYIIPDDISEYFIFEYRGLHNDKPILSRDMVRVKFI